MESEVTVELGNDRLTGWNSVVVSASLSAVAATVSLAGAALPARGLTGREPIRVLENGEPIFRGYLNSVSFEVDGERASFQADGYSLASDLVDSIIDPLGTPSEMIDRSVADIVGEYAFALNRRLPVVNELPANTRRIAKHAPVPGESYWSAVERACRSAGVLATPGPDGEIRLIAPGLWKRIPVLLRQGDNVESMRVSTSWSDRYHFLVAQGQGASTGSDWQNRLRVTGEAQDQAVRNTRVNVVQLEGNPTAEDCTARAEWEAAVRAARGTSIEVIVAGWRHSAGELWAQGTRLQTALPAIGVSGPLVVDGVTFRYDDKAQTTQLRLARADAYQAQPVVPVSQDPGASLLGWGSGQ